MEVFINECSLHEQFQVDTFRECISNFIRTINIANQINEKTVYRSTLFFDYKAIKDTHIGKTLRDNFELNSLFVQNIKSATCWQDSQVHSSTCSYNYSGNEYVNTSIAEAAERSVKSSQVILLNFYDSIFKSSTSLSVKKDGTIDLQVGCAFDESSFNNWLINQGLVNPDAKYDEKSGLAPLDSQTVLSNKSLFEETIWRNGKFGRKVYRLRGTNQLWVIDGATKHATNKAHIEVFDENTTKHLGTSLYNEVSLNANYKRNRKITLY